MECEHGTSKFIPILLILECEHGNVYSGADPYTACFCYRKMGPVVTQMIQREETVGPTPSPPLLRVVPPLLGCQKLTQLLAQLQLARGLLLLPTRKSY